MVRMDPRPAGMNQTMFMMGTSSLEWTSSGVNPDPNTMPIGLDIPMRMVARVRWSSPNQSWNRTRDHIFKKSASRLITRIAN